MSIGLEESCVFLVPDLEKKEHRFPLLSSKRRHRFCCLRHIFDVSKTNNRSLSVDYLFYKELVFVFLYSRSDVFSHYPLLYTFTASPLGDTDVLVAFTASSFVDNTYYTS